MLKCCDCCYQWREDDESYPCCHWESRAPGDVPPCEDDYFEDNEEA